MPRNQSKVLRAHAQALRDAAQEARADVMRLLAEEDAVNRALAQGRDGLNAKYPALKEH